METKIKQRHVKRQIFIQVRIIISIHTYTTNISRIIWLYVISTGRRIRDPIFVTRLSDHSAIHPSNTYPKMYGLLKVHRATSLLISRKHRTRAPLEMHPVKLEQPFSLRRTIVHPNSDQVPRYSFPGTALLNPSVSLKRNVWYCQDS